MDPSKLQHYAICAVLQSVTLDHLQRLRRAKATMVPATASAPPSLDSSFSREYSAASLRPEPPPFSVAEVDQQLYALGISECDNRLSANARNSLFQSSDAFIILFNVYDRSSFDAAKSVYEIIQGFRASSGAPAIFVGVDSGDPKHRQVLFTEGELFSKQSQIPYYEISPVSGSADFASIRSDIVRLIRATRTMPYRGGDDLQTLLNQYVATVRREMRKMKDTKAEINISRTKIKEGWILKQGGGTTAFSRKSWKRRWFILQLPSLIYQEQPDSKETLDVIALKDIIAVDRNPSEGPLAFNFHVQKRTYHLVCDSPGEMQSWMWALAAARAFLGSPRDRSMMTRQVSLEAIIVSPVQKPDQVAPVSKIEQLTAHAKMVLQIASTNSIPSSTALSIIRGDFLASIPPVPKVASVIFIDANSECSSEKMLAMQQIHSQLRGVCDTFSMKLEVHDLFGQYQDAAQSLVDFRISALGSYLYQCRQTEGVFFVLFLNEGAPLHVLPTRLNPKQYRKVLEALSSKRDSIAAKKAMNMWYKLDENKLPTGFYTLQAPCLEIDDFSSEHSLQQWTHDRPILVSAFLSTASESQVALASLLDAVVGDVILDNSRVNQTVVLVRKMQPVVKKRMSISSVSVSDSVIPTTDPNHQICLSKLDANRVVQFGPHVDGTKDTTKRAGSASDIGPLVTEIIATDIINIYQQDCTNRLIEDLLKHHRYLKDHLTFMQEGSPILPKSDAISKYLSFDTVGPVHPLFVMGDHCSGKTSLVVSALAMMPEEPDRRPVKVLRFLSCVSPTPNLREVLTSICMQLRRAFSAPPVRIPTDIPNIKALFVRLLAYATADRPLILVVDDFDVIGINRSVLHDLIPGTLPNHVRVILTATTSTSLHSQLPYASSELNILNLNHEQEVLDASGLAFLLERRMDPCELTQDQSIAVSDFIKSNQPRPLVISLMYQEVRLWQSCDSAENTWELLSDDITGGTDIDIVLHIMMLRLERCFGRALCSTCCMLLVCAKEGLSDAEMVDLLSSYDQLLECLGLPASSRVPEVVWQSFRDELKIIIHSAILPFGAPIYSIRIEACRTFFMQRYAPNDRDAQDFHEALALYFSGTLSHQCPDRCLDVNLACPVGISHRARRGAELPYQLRLARMEEAFMNMLDSQDYLENTRTENQLHMLHNELSQAGTTFDSEATHKAQDLVSLLIASVDPHRQLQLSQFFGSIHHTDSKAIAGSEFDLVKRPSPSLLLAALQLDNSPTVLLCHSLPSGHVLVVSSIGAIFRLDPKSPSSKVTISDTYVDLVDASVSSNNVLLATLSISGEITLWDLDTTDELLNFRLEDDDVPVKVRFSISSVHVLMTTKRGKLYAFPISSSHSVKEFVGHSEAITDFAVASQSDLVVSASSDCSLRSWNIQDAVSVKQFLGHLSPVTSVAVSKDDQRYASGSADKTVRIWNAARGSLSFTLTGHDDAVTSLLFSTKLKNSFIISQSANGKLRVWDLASRDFNLKTPEKRSLRDNVLEDRDPAIQPQGDAGLDDFSDGASMVSGFSRSRKASNASAFIEAHVKKYRDRKDPDHITAFLFGEVAIHGTPALESRPLVPVPQLQEEEEEEDDLYPLAQDPVAPTFPSFNLAAPAADPVEFLGTDSNSQTSSGPSSPTKQNMSDPETNVSALGKKRRAPPPPRPSVSAEATPFVVMDPSAPSPPPRPSLNPESSPSSAKEKRAPPPPPRPSLSAENSPSLIRKISVRVASEPAPAYNEEVNPLQDEDESGENDDGFSDLPPAFRSASFLADSFKNRPMKPKKSTSSSLLQEAKSAPNSPRVGRTLSVGSTHPSGQLIFDNRMHASAEDLSSATSNRKGSDSNSIISGVKQERASIIQLFRSGLSFDSLFSSVCLSARENLIIGSASDHTVIWSAETFDVLLSLPLPAACRFSVATDDDESYVALGTKDGRLFTYNLEYHTLNRTHSGFVRACSLSENGNTAFSCGDDGQVCVFDQQEAVKTPQVLIPHAGPVTALCQSHCGKALLTGSEDGEVAMWLMEDYALNFRKRGHKAPVTSISVRVDSQYFASSSLDETAIIWTFNGDICFSVRSQGAPLNHCSFSPVGHRLITSGSDGTVRVWMVNTGLCVYTYSDHPKAVNQAVFSPLGDSIITACDDGKLRLFELESKSLVVKLKGHLGPVTCCCFAPSNQSLHVLSASLDGTMKLWKTRTGELLRTVLFNNYGLVSLSCSLDPKSLLANIMVGDTEGYTYFLREQPTRHA